MAARWGSGGMTNGISAGPLEALGRSKPGRSRRTPARKRRIAAAEFGHFREADAGIDERHELTNDTAGPLKVWQSQNAGHVVLAPGETFVGRAIAGFCRL